MCLLAPHADAQGFASQVSAGYYDASVPTWAPADPTPVSTPFSFGVLWNGSWAPPTTFTITPPNSDPLPVQGIWAYPVAWNAYCQPTQFVLQNKGTIQANLRQNGTWHVVVKVTIMPGIPPWLPDVTVSLPGDVQVEHLSVDSVTWSTTDPGATVEMIEPFVGVSGPATVEMTYSVDLGDGHETPSSLNADLTVELHGLSGGLGLTEVLTGLAPPPCEVQNMPAGPVTPGLYYTQVLVNEPPGDVDSAEYLSKYLSLDGLTVGALDCTGPRELVLELTVTSDDHARLAAASQANTVAAEPTSGTLNPVAGALGLWLPGPSRTWDTFPVSLPIAGHWKIAASLLDDCGDLYHSGLPRWSPPAGAGLPIPAAACFLAYGTDQGQQDQWATLTAYAYAQLGQVSGGFDGDPDGWSFYSGRHPLGLRGGIVGQHDAAVYSFFRSLFADHVIVYAGHTYTAAGDPDDPPHTHYTWRLGDTVDLAVSPDEILTFPDGGDGMAQAKLVYAGSCYGFMKASGDSTSLCNACVQRGAQAVVAFAGESWISVECDVGTRLFSKMRAEGKDATTAVQEIRDELHAEMGTVEYEASGAHSLLARPVGTASTIAPAPLSCPPDIDYGSGS